jgi:response regulator RpfG family c-di-GMP phosphodiesterase
MTTGNPTTMTDLFHTSEVRETLLVVDDNEILRHSLADILRLEGYQIMLAENGEHALQVMELASPDMGSSFTGKSASERSGSPSPSSS